MRFRLDELTSARMHPPQSASAKKGFVMIFRMEHVNIRTGKLEDTAQFFAKLFDLRLVRRESKFPSIWMYDAREVPILHLTGIDPHDKETLKIFFSEVGERDVSGTSGSALIDHIGFVGEDFEKFKARLTASGLRFKERIALGGALKQIFVNDPNGITIEVNFPS